MRIIMNDKYITISSLTKYIKYKIDNDIHLQEVYIKGEISNFKAHSRGHFYFTLKDETSRINAIMFASSASKLAFLPKDGMKVFVTGKVSVYEATGAYQIYVSELLEDGVGNLYIAYEQLKKKLEGEGLFQQQHKKKIPKIPQKIGVITAPTGAAIRDILSTINRRWKYASTFLYPALVQGIDAKEDIVRQIKRADMDNLDVLIIGRGGGSIEDLWSFNEEIVARAIYEAKTPIISAVGHEVDFTIADFVADVRAPTPTGAAEMAVPNEQDIKNQLMQLKIRTTKVIDNLLLLKKQELKRITDKYIFKNPVMIYQAKEQSFSYLLDRLKLCSKNIIIKNQQKTDYYKNSFIFKNPKLLLDNKKHQYLQLLSKLEPLSPLLTLKRGYIIAKNKNKAIQYKKDLKKDDKLELTFQDGIVDVTVL